jgi:hypothetical protein
VVKNYSLVFLTKYFSFVMFRQNGNKLFVSNKPFCLDKEKGWVEVVTEANP